MIDEPCDDHRLTGEHRLVADPPSVKRLCGQWRDVPVQRSRDLPRGPRPEREAPARGGELLTEEGLDRTRIEHELRRTALVLVKHVGGQIPPLEIRVPEAVGPDAHPDLLSLREPSLRVRRRARGVAPGRIEEATQLLAKGVVPGRCVRLHARGCAHAAS